MTDTTNAANSSPITAECAANSLVLEAMDTWFSQSDGITIPVPFELFHEIRAALLAAPQQAGDGLTDAIRTRLARFEECAQDDEDVDIGRDWLDALTTLGLLARVRLSPARWGMTDAGRAILAAPRQPGEMGAGVEYKDSTPQLHVGDSSFEEWFSAYNPAEKGDKQRARDAYAAGMGDPLVTAASAQQDERDGAKP